MPAVTIAALGTEIIGSSEPTPAVTTARKSLVMTLISGDGTWGWTDTVSAAGATDAGIPMVVGQPVAFDAETFKFNATIRVFSTAGGVVNFQELRHP
jgi:hypothetical protein